MIRHLSLCSAALLLAAISLPCARLGAQGIPAPKAPFVAPLPNRVDFTITYQLAPKKGAAPQPVLRELSRQITRYDDVRREIVTTAGSVRLESWTIGVLNISSIFGKVSALRLDQNPEYDPGAANRFPDLQWVDQASYVKIEPYENKPCYHYAQGDNEAWIEPGTNLPVASRKGGIISTYAFGEAPKAPLGLPPEFQEALNTVLKKEARRRTVERDLQGR